MATFRTLGRCHWQSIDMMCIVNHSVVVSEQWMEVEWLILMKRKMEKCNASNTRMERVACARYEGRLQTLIHFSNALQQCRAGTSWTYSGPAMK